MPPIQQLYTIMHQLYNNINHIQHPQQDSQLLYHCAPLLPTGHPLYLLADATRQSMILYNNPEDTSTTDADTQGGGPLRGGPLLGPADEGTLGGEASLQAQHGGFGVPGVPPKSSSKWPARLVSKASHVLDTASSARCVCLCVCLFLCVLCVCVYTNPSANMHHHPPPPSSSGHSTSPTLEPFPTPTPAATASLHACYTASTPLFPYNPLLCSKTSSPMPWMWSCMMGRCRLWYT